MKFRSNANILYASTITSIIKIILSKKTSKYNQFIKITSMISSRQQFFLIENFSIFMLVTIINSLNYTAIFMCTLQSHFLMEINLNLILFSFNTEQTFHAAEFS